LFGGFNRGELNIFAGGSGSGKSLFLANMGVNWCLQGLNVMYLAFELSENLVSMRLDSMVSDIPSRDVFKSLDDVEMKVKMIGKKSGAFQVKYMPTGKTANDVRAYLKEYEIKTGRKIDVLLIDYLDLMHPIGQKISAENLFVKDKYVSEELRNLAMELNTIFVTASQLNRGAVEEIEFDHSMISGGISKINTADNVIGIFTSRAMRERGRYQIQLMKTRSSSGVGMKVDLAFNVDTLRIEDLGEDDQDQGSASNTSSSSSIVDALKRNNASSSSSSSEDPDDGAPVAKVTAKTDSTKLRDFLNNLD
jgi:replicative DNA helicase